MGQFFNMKDWVVKPIYNLDPIKIHLWDKRQGDSSKVIIDRILKVIDKMKTDFELNLNTPGSDMSKCISDMYTVLNDAFTMIDSFVKAIQTEYRDITKLEYDEWSMIKYHIATDMGPSYWLVDRVTGYSHYRHSVPAVQEKLKPFVCEDEWYNKMARIRFSSGNTDDKVKEILNNEIKPMLRNAYTKYYEPVIKNAKSLPKKAEDIANGDWTVNCTTASANSGVKYKTLSDEDLARIKEVLYGKVDVDDIEAMSLDLIADIIDYTAGLTLRGRPDLVTTNKTIITDTVCGNVKKNIMKALNRIVTEDHVKLVDDISCVLDNIDNEILKKHGIHFLKVETNSHAIHDLIDILFEASIGCSDSTREIIKRSILSLVKLENEDDDIWAKKAVEASENLSNLEKSFMKSIAESMGIPAYIDSVNVKFDIDLIKKNIIKVLKAHDVTDDTIKDISNYLAHVDTKILCDTCSIFINHECITLTTAIGVLIDLIVETYLDISDAPALLIKELRSELKK